jgi:site-specific DNA-methyltransferase (adenine-specific)
MISRRNNRKSPAESQGFDPDFLVREVRQYYGQGAPVESVWRDDTHGIYLYQGDSLVFLEQVHRKYPNGAFDLIFADPPYFLSNDGITCHAGKMVSVNKGEWDKLKDVDQMHAFNKTWLSACKEALKPNGSIFVSGTSHVIHSVGFAMQQLEFKLLNDITWVKPNPPPNLCCRYFTHASETILWAAKSKRSKHKFNYSLMREIAGQKQMKSVWYDIKWDETDVQVLLEIMPPGRDEKVFGKHPTQKPIKLLERLIMAASDKNDLVFDPFMGSGTTAVAARNLGRRCVGCELDSDFVSTAIKRLTSRREQQTISLSL